MGGEKPKGKLSEKTNEKLISIVWQFKYFFFVNFASLQTDVFFLKLSHRCCSCFKTIPVVLVHSLMVLLMFLVFHSLSFCFILFFH